MPTPYTLWLKVALHFAPKGRFDPLNFVNPTFIPTFEEIISRCEMLNWLLIPASWLYGWVVHMRNYLFDAGLLRREKFDIPIICVGNITVGGTGKTPMAEMIIDYMSRRHRVALLSRGYGRRTKGYLEVTNKSHYLDVGDEPLQIKLKFPETLVVVCEKRVEGIKRIRQQHPEIDLIILDDGFQHRYVEPKVNIIMIDSTRPPHEDRMLPAGSLRDDMDQLHRADYFVVTKCAEKMTPLQQGLLTKSLVKMAYQRIYFTRMECFRPQPLFANEAVNLSLGSEVIAMSGIGNPNPFHRSLEKDYKVVEQVVLEDHHIYKVRDMKMLMALLEQHPDASIIITEKDAVKLTNPTHIPEVIRQRLYYLPINISFIEDSDTDLLNRLEEDVRANSKIR